jgi:hypothetical protein
MITYYRLVGKLAVPCSQAEFNLDGDNRIVAQDTVGLLFVSTVFLGLDHNFGFGSDSDAVLFETMIFTDEGPDEGLSDLPYCDRYRTWGEAEKGHQKALAWAAAKMAEARETSGSKE